MTLAARIGLTVAPVATATAGTVDYLLIERYDRTQTQVDNNICLARIH